MRSVLAFLGLFIIAAFSSAPSNISTRAQEHSYTSPKVEYVVEFPSPTWRLVDEPDEVHLHAEFVYGDRNDGYLRIRRNLSTTARPFVNLRTVTRNKKYIFCRDMLMARKKISPADCQA